MSNSRGPLFWVVLAFAVALTAVVGFAGIRAYWRAKIAEEMQEIIEEYHALTKGPWPIPAPRECSPLEPGVVGYWSFDVDDWEKDQSRNSIPSKAGPRMDPAPGVKGRGLLLMHGESWFDLSSRPALNFASEEDFSMTAWFQSGG